MEISEIKTKLRRGDITTVASIVGCDEGLIKKMLLPVGHPNHRNANTRKGRQVKEAFQIIFNTRDHLRRKYANHKVA